MVKIISFLNGKKINEVILFKEKYGETLYCEAWNQSKIIASQLKKESNNWTVQVIINH